MKEQESRKIRRKMDKRMPGASCVCTLERIEQDISAKEELLARDESVSPTGLGEMINKEINDSIKRINNSIKDAVRTLVKCSMVSKMQVSTAYIPLEVFSLLIYTLYFSYKNKTKPMIDRTMISKRVSRLL